MIIGINGYIGSGKDTVGKLIQYIDITERYQNRTEDNWTVEQFSDGILDDTLPTSFWRIKKFAGKLKQIASILTGIPIEKFEDQEFKKTFLPREWDTIVSKPGKRQDGLFGTGEKMIKQMTVREFLQLLGTESIRNGLHTNAWVNATFADYKRKVQVGIDNPNDLTESGDYPDWIITDTRFPNEAQAIKDRGGIVVRVNRMKTASLEDKGLLHPSETSLDDWKFDHVIKNNGTMNQLVDQVNELITKFNLKR